MVNKEIGVESLRKLFDHKAFGKEWDLLFQAQHAGVRTTLTDWTMVFDHALYFATEFSEDPNIENEDAQLWCFMVDNDRVLNLGHDFPEMDFYKKNPFDLDGIYLINTPIYVDGLDKRLFESRLSKQQGRFIALPTSICNIPLNKIEELAPFMVPIRIPQESKSTIRKELNKFSINRKSLYIKEDPAHKCLIDKINAKIFT